LTVSIYSVVVNLLIKRLIPSEAIVGITVIFLLLISKLSALGSIIMTSAK
jgi:hypothetical protein